MNIFPLPLESLIGKAGMFSVFLLIGFLFGYVLEISGFAHSPKLAAQFYFKDMTVLKVMFTGIIVAMVLIFAASAVGLLDYNLIWVNPTYLGSGILGGIIMGFGFIIGGFCPGTSLVAVATAKIDGIFFTLGVLFGIFMFGETVGSFESFWNAGYLPRFTIPEWLGVETGWVVLGVVLMALGMFWGSEKLEQIFGAKVGEKAPKSLTPKKRFAGTGALVFAALGVLIIGQPTTFKKWNWLAPEKEPALQNREVQIHPAELLVSIEDNKLNAILLDVRSEADYNLFHLRDARHVPKDEVFNIIPELLHEPANTVFVVMSNDEAAATEAWKTLVAESVPNVYILEGGINGWLALFGEEDEGIVANKASGEDVLKYAFPAALGSRFHAADPDLHHYQLDYTPKIKLERKKGPSGGGCG